MGPGLQTSARMGRSRRPNHGRAIGSVAIWSSHNAWIVVIVVVLTTLVLGAGIPRIDTDVDVADVLPRGNPHTYAAKNVTANFKSAYTQQATIMFFTNPTAWAVDNERLPYRNQVMTDRYSLGPDNITDEVYVRAMEEFFQYVVEASEGVIRSGVGVVGFYKLINWTVAGGNDPNQNPDGDAAYSLPSRTSPTGAARYDEVHVILRATIGETLVDAVIDPTFDQTSLLLLVDPQEELSSRDIGTVYINARDAYNAAAERGELEWSVFGPDNPPLFVVDNPVANAHGSRLTQEDLATLGPLVAAFLLITLYISFRNVKGVLIAGATLLLSVVWTYGIMGFMDIPLNTLNLTVVPLILGVGIDYTVHMINEFIEHKSEGLPDDEALRITGTRAGFAMFVATLTTVIGLIVMVISPSLLIAQLGFLSALAISFTFLLTVTFIPAMLTIVRNTDAMGLSHKPSALMPAWASNISRHKVFWGAITLIITGVTLLNTVNLEKEAFGDPGSNFPEDDRMRQQHEASLIGFYDSPEPRFKTNVLVFEGDVTDVDAHRYIRAIEQNLMTKAAVNPDTLRNVVIGIESWLQIKQGGVSAVQALGLQELHGRTGNDLFDNYPETQQEIEAELREMWETPYREPISLFINYPKNDITTMTFAVTARTYIDAEEAWNDVMEAIDEAAPLKPADVTVAFVGNTATNYLFIEEELPWLNYMTIVASISVILLVIWTMRDWRATGVVGLVIFLTTVWFMGVLPWLDIGLAITLVLPLVFIFNVGTDYAVHMAWNIRQLGDPYRVMRNVGKSVLFSAITTVGAFALFIPVRNVAMAKTMLAVAIAIAVSFVATILVVSLLYNVRPKPETEAAHDAVAPGYEFDLAHDDAIGASARPGHSVAPGK